MAFIHYSLIPISKRNAKETRNLSINKFYNLKGTAKFDAYS
jgi:hypothetical protein